MISPSSISTRMTLASSVLVWRRPPAGAAGETAKLILVLEAHATAHSTAPGARLSDDLKDQVSTTSTGDRAPFSARNGAPRQGRPMTVSVCSGPRPRVVIGSACSGCEGSVRARAVLRAAGGARGGPGADDRPVAGSDRRAGHAHRRAGCADCGVGAAAGRLVAELVEAAVERRVGQAGAQVAARAVRA